MGWQSAPLISPIDCLHARFLPEYITLNYSISIKSSVARNNTHGELPEGYTDPSLLEVFYAGPLNPAGPTRAKYLACTHSKALSNCPWQCRQLHWNVLWETATTNSPFCLLQRYCMWCHCALFVETLTWSYFSSLSTRKSSVSPKQLICFHLMDINLKPNDVSPLCFRSWKPNPGPTSDHLGI